MIIQIESRTIEFQPHNIDKLKIGRTLIEMCAHSDGVFFFHLRFLLKLFLPILYHVL